MGKPKRKYTRKAPPKPKHKPIPVEGDADDTTAEQKKPKRKYVRKKKVLIQQEEVKGEDRGIKREPSLNDEEDGVEKKKMKKILIKPEDDGDNDDVDDVDDDAEKEDKEKELIK